MKILNRVVLVFALLFTLTLIVFGATHGYIDWGSQWGQKLSVRLGVGAIVIAALVYNQRKNRSGKS